MDDFIGPLDFGLVVDGVRGIITAIQRDNKRLIGKWPVSEARDLLQRARRGELSLEDRSKLTRITLEGAAKSVKTSVEYLRRAARHEQSGGRLQTYDRCTTVHPETFMNWWSEGGRKRFVQDTRSLAIEKFSKWQDKRRERGRSYFIKASKILHFHGTYGDDDKQDPVAKRNHARNLLVRGFHDDEFSRAGKRTIFLFSPKFFAVQAKQRMIAPERTDGWVLVSGEYIAGLLDPTQGSRYIDERLKEIWVSADAYRAWAKNHGRTSNALWAAGAIGVAAVAKEMSDDKPRLDGEDLRVEIRARLEALKHSGTIPKQTLVDEIRADYQIDRDAGRDFFNQEYLLLFKEKVRRGPKPKPKTDQT